MEVRLKHTLYHRDQDRSHQEGKRSNPTLTTLPLPQAGEAPHGEVSPEPMVPPEAKESPGWTSSFPIVVAHFLGVPLLSCLRGIAGESVELDHWESDCDGEGRRACRNQDLDFGRPSSY